MSFDSSPFIVPLLSMSYSGKVTMTLRVSNCMKKTALVLIIGVGLVALAYGVAARSSAPLKAVPVDGWAHASDEATRITFQYPEKLSETYIHVNDWPPSVQKKAGTLICKEGESGTGIVEKTERRTIEGREYCVISSQEGAAGSVYGQYHYRADRGDGIVTVMFTLRYEQCGLYDGDKRTLCESERSAFNLDSLVDQIVMSVGDTE